MASRKLLDLESSLVQSLSVTEFRNASVQLAQKGGAVQLFAGSDPSCIVSQQITLA